MTHSIHLYQAAQVRELDRVTIQDRGVPGLILMRRAAKACVEELLARWPDPKKVAVLCGSGNNAADGFIIAGLLANRGVICEVGLVGRIPEQGTDAGSAHQFCLESGVSLVSAPEAMAQADLLVDALLGTGLAGDVRPEYAEAIAAANGSGLPILAVDVPSGLCSDSGCALGDAICAEVTVTFIGRKLGLYTADGAEHSGDIVFNKLDVPDDVYDEVPFAATCLNYADVSRKLPPRHRNSHKKSHGHVLIVGGNQGMGGAVIMAAESAIMTGAGLVSVATHPTNVASLLSRRPEVMPLGVSTAKDLDPLLKKVDVVVLGPGLGQDDFAKALFAAVLETDKPMVLDADGLNLLSESPVTRENWILTPHPGEARRLIDCDIQSDRLSAVKTLQERYGGVSLLKGAGTLIADGSEVSLVPYGNPGMAVGGMGDVLSGVIGSLLAQTEDQLLSAQLGAVIHSLAADNLVSVQGERGLLATELAPEIRKLLN